MALSKLRGASGETMVETLVSILISALALTVLATVIGTSVRMVDQSKDHMKKFYEAESEMLKESEKPDGGSSSETLSIDVPLKKDEKLIPVKVYAPKEGTNVGIVYYERSTQ